MLLLVFLAATAGLVAVVNLPSLPMRPCNVESLSSSSNFLNLARVSALASFLFLIASGSSSITLNSTEIFSVAGFVRLLSTPLAFQLSVSLVSMGSSSGWDV
ncbi:hypothetical protein WICPIJ_008567 [Wickerhamomyces pijperi]|uniref:Secreted peptide n=1 Tax=Wickerhamomyces pijperi TaxID=599730 RepID=A0A9P8PWL5_WICPI|nr:hypothetical protein WICPIJ_008567 [Wickerhamomyces pijperi]